MSKKNIYLIIIFFTIGLSSQLFAQQLPEYEKLKLELEPIELARFVADKIVDHTGFEFEYVLQNPYSDIESIDFGRNFNKSEPGVAYALSTLVSEEDQIETFELGRTCGVKIWVNDQLVFTKANEQELPILFEEKTYVLPEKFEAKLGKGENKILVKSTYNGRGEWLFLLQSKNLGPYAEKGKKIKTSVKNYAPNINLVNWLILGCYENVEGEGFNRKYDPENKIEFHRIFRSGNKTFTWDIPRIHIITGNPNGGRFYSWSYHVGGFIWGLQTLGQITGKDKYRDFANKWCEYSLSIMPLVEYQTKDLHAVRSMNWGSIGRPMLDYTSAPSIPFMARLVNEKSFPNQRDYIQYAEKIMNYLINEQFRLSDGVFARKYTITPSVWADDMFMGIPYLLLSAQYTNDSALKKRLFDDAANQIILFNKYLYRKDKKLYMQACYVNNTDQKIPLWSRGNGWAVWGTSEVLKHLPKNHKEYNRVLEIFKEHIDGIVECQDQDGFWHNILDMPETVRESSGAAMFTMAIARGINNGWLDRERYRPVLEKAWKSLKTFIDNEGNLHGVKGGTNFSPDPKDYERTPFVKSDTHGILPLLFACIEMDRFYKN